MLPGLFLWIRRFLRGDSSESPLLEQGIPMLWGSLRADVQRVRQTELTVEVARDTGPSKPSGEVGLGARRQDPAAAAVGGRFCVRCSTHPSG
jgi:hypothetical protein